MAALEKGITANGTGYAGKTWNILGQVYFPKAVTNSTFAFETNSEPGQFVPVHIHPTQDEFILVQEGVLDLKLDGVWVQAKAGDLVRLPRGIPHGYFNKSDKPARALFWVSPMQKLEALFNQLHNLTDPAEVVRISRTRSGLLAARGQRIVFAAVVLRPSSDGALAPPQDEVLFLRQNFDPHGEAREAASRPCGRARAVRAVPATARHSESAISPLRKITLSLK